MFATKLPIDLQLQVLIDNLSIYEANKVIRNNFPHLIDYWLSPLKPPLNKWFALFARERTSSFSAT